MSDEPKPHQAFLPVGKLEDALPAIPLFPLPQVVMMPKALLPLYVFEPRYRRMVRDVLDSHGILAVVQLRDGTAAEPNGQPAIHAVAGAGLIIDCAEMPGGRFSIVLRGLARVALEELPFVEPYRRASARVLEPTQKEVSSTHTAALISVATQFASLLKSRDSSFDFRMPKVSDGGTLADHFATHLLIDGRDRQRALEMTDVAARVTFVTETLVVQQLGLAGARGEAN